LKSNFHNFYDVYDSDEMGKLLGKKGERRKVVAINFIKSFAVRREKLQIFIFNNFP
jgi:predicted RNA-binding protein YlqC (UPF0109 family)